MPPTSFPYMRIAKYLGVDYGRILRIADALDRGDTIRDPLIGNVRWVWEAEVNRRLDVIAGVSG